MTDTYEATTELGKAMNVVQQSAEGLASSFGELSDESKVWTIASRILSGSGLWKLQNRIRALGQITAWYNRIQLQSIQNQIKAAEANLQQKKTLDILEKGKNFSRRNMTAKGMKSDRWKQYIGYYEQYMDMVDDAGKNLYTKKQASRMARDLVREQYGGMFDELKRSRDKILKKMMQPKRLLKWITGGETFDAAGKSKGTGGSFMESELDRFWTNNKLRMAYAWILLNIKNGKMWEAIKSVGGGLKRILSAAGTYFIMAMYYIVIITTGITLLVWLFKKMELGKAFKKFEEQGKGLFNIFTGVVEILKGVFMMIKAMFTGDMSMLVNGLGKILSGVFKLLLGMFLTVVQVIFTIIKGVVTGITKSLGWAGRLIGIGDGKGRFASGGITPGGMVLVGERGPELVNLPKGSRVHSNAQSSRMVGNNIHVHINGRVGASDAEIRDIANKVAREINLKMNRTGATAGRF